MKTELIGMEVWVNATAAHIFLSSVAEFSGGKEGQSPALR